MKRAKWLISNAKIIKHLSDYKNLLESIGHAGEDKETDEDIVELSIIIGRLYNSNVEIIGPTLNRKYLDEFYAAKSG